jgi:hypothetical protein
MIAPDAAARRSLDQKLELIRDRVRGVACGFDNGLYLWGEGGTSKSFTVQGTLDEMQTTYKLTNTRVTAKGLFELLREFPNVVHIIDDAETLLADRHAIGLLRSALWGQDGPGGRQVRPVTWQVAGNREEVIFTGGIILICNLPLDNLPEVRALKTRIPVLRYAPTCEEVIVMMHDIAAKGHRHGDYKLTPDECLEVVHEVVSRFQNLQRTPDIRLLINGFKDRIQWASGSSTTHWKDLLESRLREQMVPVSDRYLPRSERKLEEQAIARRIMHLPPQERLQVWNQETGKSQPALYRRLAEVRVPDSQFSRFSESEK